MQSSAAKLHKMMLKNNVIKTQILENGVLQKKWRKYIRNRYIRRIEHVIFNLHYRKMYHYNSVYY